MHATGRGRAWAVATVSIVVGALGAGVAEARTTLVEVEAAGPLGAQQLERLGLDVVRASADGVEVQIHGAADAERLAASGLPSRVLVEDLDVLNRRQRAIEARLEARRDADADAGPSSELPTGRLAYRTLEEINAEMQRLATRFPNRIRLIELPHRSLLGKRIWGLEISHQVRRDLGKPAFLNTGVHHAREWPTAEFVLEFAWDLMQSDDRDPRITALLDRGQVIAVPVVNPDGYDVSRRLVQEQKRKNCRVVAGEIPTAEQCEDPANANAGVDPNRNYGAFWGGPGSSASPTASNYRGEAPFSEPEIRNMRELSASNPVTVAINNHTPDERLLRAPSASNEPIPADVEVYDALAQRLGADLRFPSGPWPEVYYEASGTAEQTAYYSAGTLAFTPELTPGFVAADRFHPPYEFVVDQYRGIDRYLGSSVRAAYLTAFAAAVEDDKHATIVGRAPAGTRLRISKSFPLTTSLIDGTGPALTFPFDSQSTVTVPRSGRFTWHGNPSLRPSQSASQLIQETWTVACGPGRFAPSVQVSVARGGTALTDLRGCER